jgi:uncharacterized membrane protein SirB2
MSEVPIVVAVVVAVVFFVCDCCRDRHCRSVDVFVVLLVLFCVVVIIAATPVAVLLFCVRLMSR